MSRSNGHSDSSGEAERIRRHMQQVRAHMARDIDQIADATRTMADWRTYVRRYPWLFVGSAAVLGFMLVPHRPRKVMLDLEALRQLGAGCSVNVQKERPRPTLMAGLLSSLVSLGAQQAMRGVSRYVDQRMARAAADRVRPQRGTE